MRWKNCGQPCVGSLTCNARGKSSFSAQDLGATICCARCPHPVQLGVRKVVASYWASWADALPMLHGRMPAVAERVTTILAREGLVEGCLSEVQSAARTLDRHGFVGRPDWSELHLGVRPPPYFSEPGKWPHGWQYHASSASDTHYRESAADQAHLRSHSGGGSGEVFCGCPTAPEFQIQPSLFRTLILERLLTEAHCECGARLDRGRHRAACGRSGRLRSRATATEKTLTGVSRSRCDGTM